MFETIVMIGMLVPIVALLLPVAIVWVVLHYRARDKAQSGFSQQDIQRLEELSRLAESMAERIEALETILDAEVPDWRDYHEQKR